jgi:hypothetical protein
MTPLTVRNHFASRKVFDEAGDLMATFTSEVAFSLFLSGLVHDGTFSLFDTTDGKCLVGTVAQLDEV